MRSAVIKRTLKQGHFFNFRLWVPDKVFPYGEVSENGKGQGRAARAIPRSCKEERAAALSALRDQYGFREYALHEYAKATRCSFLADHLDAVLAQRLATRAYQALNRVCMGKARRVRFKSRGRGLGSLENKRNDTGLRFVLQSAQEGHAGYMVWHDDQLQALINWNDAVVKHGLDHRIKYARLIRRRASSPRGRL